MHCLMEGLKMPRHFQLGRADNAGEEGCKIAAGWHQAGLFPPPPAPPALPLACVTLQGWHRVALVSRVSGGTALLGDHEIPRQMCLRHY